MQSPCPTGPQGRWVGGAPPPRAHCTLAHHAFGAHRDPQGERAAFALLSYQRTTPDPLLASRVCPHPAASRAQHRQWPPPGVLVGPRP